MKIVATIEARLGSSRLPDKVLLPAAGKPMLEHLIERLRRVASLDAIVVATAVNPRDSRLLELAARVGVAAYAGSEEDVMERVIGAAESAGADLIVEITGDCPIIDPRIVEQTIGMYTANSCDYASNVQFRSYPDGMDTQVFLLETLKRSAGMTTDPVEREHVSLHIRRHPGVFRQVTLVAPPDERWPELGLTLDEEPDYQLLKRIIEHFGAAHPYFSCREVVELLRTRGDWVDINRHVRRKGDT